MAQATSSTSGSKSLSPITFIPAIIQQYFGALANRLIWKTPPPVKLSDEELAIIEAAQKIDNSLFQRIDHDPLEEDGKEATHSSTACGVEAMAVFAESEPDLQTVKVQAESGELTVSRGLLRDLRNKDRDLWRHRISGTIRNPVKEEDEPAIVEELYQMSGRDQGLLSKVTFFANQNMAIRIRHSITGQFVSQEIVTRKKVTATPMFDPLTPCEIDIDKISDGIVRVTCAYNGAIKKVAYPDGDADILETPINFRSLGSFKLGKSDDDDTSEISVQFK